MAQLHVEITKAILTARIREVRLPKKYTYAYYLIRNGQIKEKTWYTDNLSVEYALSKSGIYQVRAFVKEIETDDATPIIVPSEELHFIHSAVPLSLPYLRIEEMEMTNLCNLSCPNCPTPSTRYPRGLIDDRTVLSALSWTQKGQTLNYHRHGEPLLHNRLETYLKWGVEAGVRPVVSTNGLLLTQARLETLYQAGLRRVIITLHTPESIKAFVEVCAFAERNKVPLYNISEHAKDLGADALFFVGKILNVKWEKGQPNTPGEELHRLERQHPDLLKLEPVHTWAGNVPKTRDCCAADTVKHRQKNCVFIQKRTVNMRWDGSIVGCCFDSENENEIGHIRDFLNIRIDLDKYRLCPHCDDNWAVRTPPTYQKQETPEGNVVVFDLE